MNVTSKIPLVLCHSQVFHLLWKLFPELHNFFTIENYRSDKKYQQNSLFLFQARYTNKNLSQQLLAQGHKVVIHQSTEQVQKLEQHCLNLYSLGFWYCYPARRQIQNGWQVINTKQKFTHSVLLQMRNPRWFRDRVFEYVKQCHNNTFYYSYISRSRYLPNEKLLGNSEIDVNSKSQDWYESTRATLVMETSVQGNLLVSEKSFDPIRCRHPFIIMGIPGTLAAIKKYGFETFENLFDESYDSENDFDLRLDAIMKTINEFHYNWQDAYDKITLEKLEFNQARYFDNNHIKYVFTQEIINPLLEYANS